MTDRTATAPPSLCLAAFRLWLVLGAASLAVSDSFGTTTPVGPLAIWLVAIPLASLILLAPCRACIAIASLARAPYARVRPQARRFRRTAS